MVRVEIQKVGVQVSERVQSLSKLFVQILRRKVKRGYCLT